jgi:hypothetical protein
MAEIIQPEGVDMFHIDLEHIHAVLRNRSYGMESLMRQVSAGCSAQCLISLVCTPSPPVVIYSNEANSHKFRNESC